MLNSLAGARLFMDNQSLAISNTTRTVLPNPIEQDDLRKRRSIGLLSFIFFILLLSKGELLWMVQLQQT